MVEDPGAPADDGVKEIQTIVADFERGIVADAEKPGSGSTPNMADLESKFIQQGRYLDLVGIYQNMIEKNTLRPDSDDVDDSGERAGATSTGPIELRLARAYLRLGQTHFAREMLDKMIQQNSDSPMTWFLNAAYWLPEAADSQDAAARVIVNWQKTLEIAPGFVGFDQPDAPPLREQLAVLRQRTPADKVAAATAALHKKMNRNAVEKNEQNSAVSPVVEAEDKSDAVADNVAVASQKADSPHHAQTASSTAKNNVIAPTTTPPKNAKPQRIPFMIAHANMALAQGQPAQAVELFEQVLARDADHFDAQFGLIRAGWSDPSKRPELKKKTRQLAARTDLKPRDQLELGRFVYFDLEDGGLAVKLWERVKKQAPGLAKSAGLNAMIEDAKSPADAE